MRKIKNVHLNDPPELYQCFGCSPNNKHGMKLEFWEDGDQLVSTWVPDKMLMGWYNVLHGGIQSTLMDEIAAWVVYVKCGTAGVTAELNVKFRKPVLIDQGPITIKAELKEQNKRLATIQMWLISNGEICAEGEAKYFIYPEAIAREKFNYPGIDAFFEQ